MAQNDTVQGRYAVFLVGDGAEPEQFHRKGVATISKELSKSLNMGSRPVADKDDPTQVTVDKSFVVSKPPRSISLEAEFSLEGCNFMDSWLESAVRKNFRLGLIAEGTSDTIEGYWSGSAWVSELSVGAPDEDLISLSTSLTVYGELPLIMGSPD